MVQISIVISIKDGITQKFGHKFEVIELLPRICDKNVHITDDLNNDIVRLII